MLEVTGLCSVVPEAMIDPALVLVGFTTGQLCVWQSSATVPAWAAERRRTVCARPCDVQFVVQELDALRRKARG